MDAVGKGTVSDGDAAFVGRLEGAPSAVDGDEGVSLHAGGAAGDASGRVEGCEGDVPLLDGC